MSNPNNTTRTGLIGIIVACAALIIGILIGFPASDGGATLTPTETPADIQVQGLNPSISNLPVQCKKAGQNCVEGWNGASIVLSSDPGGITHTVVLDGKTGDVQATGSIAIGTWNRALLQQTLSVTNTATFTPTGMFQPVISTLNVTPTLSTAFSCSTAVGCPQLLLENLGSYTITLVVSPTTVLTPGTLRGFVFDGVGWVRRQ